MKTSTAMMLPVCLKTNSSQIADVPIAGSKYVQYNAPVTLIRYELQKLRYELQK